MYHFCNIISLWESQSFLIVHLVRFACLNYSWLVPHPSCQRISSNSPYPFFQYLNQQSTYQQCITTKLCNHYHQLSSPLHNLVLWNPCVFNSWGVCMSLQWLLPIDTPYFLYLYRWNLHLGFFCPKHLITSHALDLSCELFSVTFKLYTHLFFYPFVRNCTSINLWLLLSWHVCISSSICFIQFFIHFARFDDMRWISI